MAKKDQAEMPATERETAPETVIAPEPVYTPPAYVPRSPRQMQIERQGESGSAYSRRFPQVRGGVCEYCGVLDGNVPSQYQYKLCPHYRGMQLRCSYCPETKDVDEVIYHANLNIAEHPENPNKLVVWCDSFECSKKHLERFKVGAS